MKNNLLERSIIILDKPSNYDSHQVTALIKRILNVDKIGHGGTLDPKVTGVLIIGIGRATRLLEYTLKAGKEYVGVMRLHGNVSLKKLRDVTSHKFTGKIKQIPPVKSAVKREERTREIYEFNVLEKDKNDFLFAVSCESGTYIRKLIHDLGQELKIGAHMLELRRIREGWFEEKDAVTLYDIEDAIEKNNLERVLKPINIFIDKFPKLTAKDEYLEKLYNGFPVIREFITQDSKTKFKKGELVIILSQQDQPIEIAEIVNEENIFAKPKVVFGEENGDKNKRTSRA